MQSSLDLLPAWLARHDDDQGAIDDQRVRPCPSPSLAPPPHVTLTPWDDGFTPSGCSRRRGKMVLDQARATPEAFTVVDKAVSKATADRLYSSAVQARVWGVYVRADELRGPMALRTARAALAEAGPVRGRGGVRRHVYREALARVAVLEFLVGQATDVITATDWADTHGVAVWVIASDPGDETEYHLDYAEMVRFETNVIVPPRYGATLHVSPLVTNATSVAYANETDSTDATTNINTYTNTNNAEQGAADDAARVDATVLGSLEGGGFFVNRRGLAHYREYGYKTRKAGKLCTDELEARAMHEPGWSSVAYQYRRGIICDGEFPHFSARVRSITPPPPPPEWPRSACSPPVKRVVVGFNLFGHEIGAFVERYPEHSEAFNRHVKLSQTAVRHSEAHATMQWSLADLKKNPKQAAFIKYLARKLREKKAATAKDAQLRDAEPCALTTGRHCAA